MAVQKVSLLFDADNTRAMQSIGQLNGAVLNLGADFKSQFANALTAGISATVILEAAKSTAQWAEDIKKTSDELDISTDSLQTLEKMATRAGVAVDKLHSMFEKLNAQKQLAMEGDMKAQEAFAKHGIAYNQDLGTMFEQITKQQDKGETIRDLIGIKNITAAEAIGKQLSAVGGLEAANKGYLASGQNAPEKTIDEMSDTLEATKAQWHDFMVAMTPIFKVLLGLLNMLVGALTAVVHVITDSVGLLYNAVMLAIHGIRGLLHFKFLGGESGKEVSDNVTEHANKMTENFIRLKDTAVGTAIGIGQVLSFGQFAADFKSNNNRLKSGLQLGNAAAIVGTVGIGGAAGAGSRLAVDYAAAAEAAGKLRTASALLKVGTTLEKVSASPFVEPWTKSIIKKTFDNHLKLPMAMGFKTEGFFSGFGKGATELSFNKGKNIYEVNGGLNHAFSVIDKFTDKLVDVDATIGTGIRITSAGSLNVVDNGSVKNKSGLANVMDNPMVRDLIQSQNSGLNTKIGDLYGVDLLAQTSLAQQQLDVLTTSQEYLKEVATNTRKKNEQSQPEPIPLW